MIDIHVPGFYGRRRMEELSPEHVAAQCGVSLSTLKNWEAGRTVPRCTPEQMLNICKVYDCTLEQLVEMCKESSEAQS